MFGMTATEFVLLNNTDRDALREPWPVRPFALELQENHKVRVTLFGLRKLNLASCPLHVLERCDARELQQHLQQQLCSTYSRVASSLCCLPRHALA